MRQSGMGRIKKGKEREGQGMRDEVDIRTSRLDV